MPRGRIRKRRAKSEIALIAVTLALPIFCFIMWYIIPNLGGFTQSVLNSQGNFTWENFERVFKTLADAESDLVIGFKNTFLCFLLGAILHPFRVMVSFFLYKKIPGHGLWRILFLLPGLVMGVAMARVQQQLLMPTGFIAEWIGKLEGLEYVPELLADSRYANLTLYFLVIWLGFPGDIILWGGTFARIPQDMLEAGRIDGTNWFTEFTKIVLPLVWPTFCLTLVLMTCSMFNAGTNAFLMTKGAYGTMTFACWMQLQMLYGSGNGYASGVFGFMSAVGICVTIIAVPLSLFVRKYAGRAFQEVEF